MALNARLLGRSIFCCHGLRPVYVTQLRPVTIRARPAEVPMEEGHDERNMRLCRPQSPHLTIYRPQLTSMLSITHRFTGIILGGYASTFAVVSLLSSKPMSAVVDNISHCYPTFFLVFKLGLIFPFTYHFFNGIRHLVWDNGQNLTIKGVYSSGYMMLLAAGVSGLALLSPVITDQVWDTGSALTLKAVYVSGYLMLLCSMAAAAGTVYFAEELKAIELEKAELLRKLKEEEAKARALAEEGQNQKKKKKK